jgi:hypothetical protein
MDAVNATATYRKPFDDLRKSRFEKWSALLDDFRTFYSSGLADEAPPSAPNRGWLLTARNLTNFQVGIEREDASEQPVAPEENQTNLHSGPLPSSLSPPATTWQVDSDGELLKIPAFSGD